MDNKERDIKMQLLQELIDEMGGSAVESKFGKKPVAHVTEVKEQTVPLDKLKETIKEKLQGESEPDASDPCESMEDDEPEDSRLMRKLRTARNKQ